MRPCRARKLFNRRKARQIQREADQLRLYSAPAVPACSSQMVVFTVHAYAAI